MKPIDDFLNNITMYRLLLYYLVFLVLIASLLAAFDLIPYSPVSILLSTLIIVLVSWATNTLFASVYQAPTNLESVYISALILALVIAPLRFAADLPFLVWASIWSMASKYMFTLNRKHIFNPVAFALSLTALTLSRSANWWVGTAPMLPLVFIGGCLIVRKIRRTGLVASFFIAALVSIFYFTISSSTPFLPTLRHLIFNTAFFFFAFVMLTEPLTTPPTRILQILYGSLVGIMFAPQFHLGSLYSTPELALLAGNVFSYLVSPKQKLILKLKDKIPLGPGLYDYIFTSTRPFKFHPGQYMEWTFAHDHPDSRGTRRYFTLASSPTENDIRVGIKFPDHSSSYKQSLLNMDDTQPIIASQLAGDFVLPRNPDGKYVFIAGGIGITPFRSMVKFLLDKNETRNIILFYSSPDPSEFVYRDIFQEAQKRWGMKTVYVITNKDKVPPGWSGQAGRIDSAMLRREVPDYLDRTYYLSGPRSMVLGVENLLRSLSIPSSQIITDYFPGFV